MNSTRRETNIYKSYLDLLLAAAWLGGILSQQSLGAPFPRLPLYVLVLLLVWRYWRGREGCRWLLGALLTFSLGLLWASISADRVTGEKLDSSMNRQRCSIQGRIEQVDQQTAALTRFVLRVDELSCGSVAVDQVRRVRLSWYRPAQELHPGEFWSLLVRLKRPHGFANPGLFDYSAWLAQRHIGATGYVDIADPPVRLSVEKWSLVAWRSRLVEEVRTQLAGHPQAAFITALSIGNRSEVSDYQWQVIRASGTSHLLAISGLHIGLVGAFFWWLGQWLWRKQSRWLLPVPSPLAGALAGWLAAFSYALLSGFAVPAQRAMIMFSVVVVATLLRREPFSRRSYLIAMVLVLAWEPLAVTQAGFWLSFAALAVIGWSLVGRRTGSRLLRLLHIQFALWLGLMPLVLLFFDQLSLVALPANLLAIPLVTLVVLPLALAGVGLLLIAPGVGQPLLNLAAEAMALTWQWLEWITTQGEALAGFAQPMLTVTNPWIALMAFAGMLWLLAPRGFPARWLGLGCLIPLVTPQFAVADHESLASFSAQVIDVGQGLAVIVTTTNHTLVYDTGARFSERFDAGADLLVPLLRPLLKQRSGRIDRLIISHGDNDHAGGLPGLLTLLPVARIDSGTPEQLAHDTQPTPALCRSGERWQWDGVWFEYLHQPATTRTSDNDRSCILRVGGQQGLLLPGDLSDRGERRLINYLRGQKKANQLRADVLLVPHHGSRYASTRKWIAAVAPELALVSSGYANRFGHPHPLTVERYRAGAVELVNTATDGAVALRFDNSGLLHWSAHNRADPRYWH